MLLIWCYGNLGFHRWPRGEWGVKFTGIHDLSGNFSYGDFSPVKLVIHRSTVADSSSIYNPVFEIIRHWMYFYEFREGIVFVRKRDIDIASYGLSIDSFLWIMNQSIFIVKECPIFSNEKHEHYHQKCQIENGIFYYFENIIEKHMTVSTMANMPWYLSQISSLILSSFLFQESTIYNFLVIWQ